MLNGIGCAAGLPPLRRQPFHYRQQEHI